MDLRYFKYAVFFLIFVFLVSCKQTKYVPEGKYLLAGHEIHLHKNDQLDVNEMYGVLKQKPNARFIFKFKLGFFNMVDSAKVAEKRAAKNIKLNETNMKRLDRQDKINRKRRAKALKKGKEYYRIKQITLKDTVNPKKIFSEWIKYTLGEPPSILDSTLAHKTDKQLNLYLQKKGYYEGKVTDTIVYDSLKRKAWIRYDVYPGTPMVIDSIYIDNESAKNTQWGLRSWLGGKSTKAHQSTKLEKGAILDSDMLNKERNLMTKYMREQGFFGFYPEHVYFEIDTFELTHTANIKIKVKPRLIPDENDKNKIDPKDHVIYTIRDVYYHCYETPTNSNETILLDTLIYEVKEKKKEPYNLIFYFEREKKPGAGYLPNPKKPFVKPKIVGFQSFLEPGKYYKSYNTERTYRRLQALGVFRSINLQLNEVGPDSLDAHFYLLKAKKQSFKVEPRGTYSNGFLGLSATMGYTNKNLFRGAEKFTVSITGGFESQPTILTDSSGTKKGLLFNTWEIGAAATLEVPGLLPIPYLTFGKLTFPITIYSLSYNHQSRPDFVRDLFQVSYLYRWSPSDPRQVFNSGFPLINNIKYVQIDIISEEFQKRLDDLNDLFLQASYSDQFIWEDFRLGWTFNNGQTTQSNTAIYFNTSFVTAGYFLEGVTLLDSKVKNKPQDSIPKVFGVPYSKFLRLDNELRIYHTLSPKMSMNYRFMGGLGIPDPGGDIQKALPYDYSFYAGGSSDNRGWVSRALGPGAYRYYADTARTETQIGDIRMLFTAEFRFDIYKYLKGAIFADASNVWTYYNDPNRQGGQISWDFWKEFALNAGVGIRLDFDFFQIRLDVGFPLYDPSLPEGERWVGKPGELYKQAIEDAWEPIYGDISYDVILKNQNIQKPFVPRFNFGIGYPF
ncbi:MAG: BamA/TamA family outer membrane protein [Crocinitomicaceae bacterium]|nr:BamA/TamA family outer membrane protein [Crocinitomicaceae bacterium]